MNKITKNIFKGSIIFTIGQFSAKLLSFLLIPLYTRFLTPQDYGIAGYLIVISSFLAAILGFGISEFQIRELADLKEKLEKKQKFLFSINIFLLFFTFIFSLLLFLAGDNIINFFNIKIPFSPYFIIIIWTIPFQILNQINISYNLAMKEYNKCTLKQLLLFLFINTFTIIFVCFLKLGALGKITGILSGNIFYFICFFPISLKRFKTPDLNLFKAHIFTSLSFGIPMVIHQIAMMIHTSMDRLILERFVSFSELGLYSFAYQIGMLLQAVTLSINRAIQPNYYELMKNKNSKFKKQQINGIFKMWMLIIGSISALGILWIKEVIYLVIPFQYHNSYKVASIIFFSYFIGIFYFYFSLPLFYYKKTKLIPFITLIATILNICLNIILIPQFGITGAAYATFFSYLAQTILAYFAGIRLYNPNYPLKKIFLYIISIFSIFIVFQYDFNTLEFYFIKSIYTLFFSIIFYKYIKKFLNN
ncbi:MAG: oligosaccharide flippase family protein [Candidatus Muirbacterium halophilum]|nr:oligosaccharide flippase family protein [Candidatus Muirbacterium halophilum]MCK9476615.1 oligosaccharide flippase family protein [Candidatus Muirbacterium halophilum]